MTPTQNSHPRRRGRASIAALAATAALFGGGAALSPSHAAAMSDDSLGCIEEQDEPYFLFELDTDCWEEGAGGGGSSGDSGGNDPWDGGWQVDQGSTGSGSRGSDLWEGWSLDRGTRGGADDDVVTIWDETPREQWAREEEEAQRQYRQAVREAEKALQQAREERNLREMKWLLEKNLQQANRAKERADHDGAERPRGGKARKDRGGRR